MAITRVDIATVQGRVIAALNATTAATWSTTVITDDRRNLTEIQKAILAGDAQVCLAICETLGHGYRSLFLSDIEITHGAKLPDHIGPIEMLRIEPYDGATLIAGIPKDADDIDSMRVNSNDLYDTVAHDEEDSSLAGYFKIIGDEIRYTGFSAWALLANFTRTAACQSPEAYEDAVFSLAVMNLVKEGDSAPFANLFAQQGQQYLGLIRGNAMLIPPTQIAQAA